MCQAYVRQVALDDARLGVGAALGACDADAVDVTGVVAPLVAAEMQDGDSLGSVDAADRARRICNVLGDESDADGPCSRGNCWNVGLHMHQMHLRHGIGVVDSRDGSRHGRGRSADGASASLWGYSDGASASLWNPGGVAFVPDCVLFRFCVRSVVLRLNRMELWRLCVMILASSVTSAVA